MNAFGIPGIGGSLGSCAFCGESFLGSILTGGKFQPFSVNGNRLAAHPECWDKYGKSYPKDWPKGPLKIAYDKALQSEEKVDSTLTQGAK